MLLQRLGTWWSRLRRIRPRWPGHGGDPSPRVLRRVARAGIGGFAISVHAAGMASPGTAVNRPDPSPPREVVIPGTVEVPFLDASSEDPRPIVEAMVNGTGPHRFRVETGARLVGITRQLAGTLGLVPVGGPSDLPDYMADSISLGAATFKGVRLVTLPLRAGDIAGVLGLPLFEDLLLTLDYPGRRLRLARESLPPPNGRDVVALSRAGDFWNLPITLGGVPASGLLDTQSSGAVGIPPALAEKLTFDGGLRTIGKARGAFGEVAVKGGRLAGEMVIGGYRFPHPFVSVRALPPPFPQQPIIGSKVLQHFVISLDQRHERLRLTHAGTVIQLAEPQASAPRPSAPP
jgi:Aspartyl protease